MADWDDRRPQRDRIMDEMEENRDRRVRRAFHSAGEGDNGPGGMGRVDPYTHEDDHRLGTWWDRARRQPGPAERDRGRERDHGYGHEGRDHGRESRDYGRERDWGRDERDYGRERGGWDRDVGGYSRDFGGAGDRRYGLEYGNRSSGQEQGGERDWHDRSGRVTSWFSGEDEQRGQQSHRGRGPRGYKRTDERITEEVNDRLTDDPRVDASEIQVHVQNGEVTLTGNVDSKAARRRAEDIADSVSGVTYVMNNLRVRQEGTTGATG